MSCGKAHTGEPRPEPRKAQKAKSEENLRASNPEDRFDLLDWGMTNLEGAPT